MVTNKILLKLNLIIFYLVTLHIINGFGLDTIHFITFLHKIDRNQFMIPIYFGF